MWVAIGILKSSPRSVEKELLRFCLGSRFWLLVLRVWSFATGSSAVQERYDFPVHEVLETCCFQCVHDWAVSVEEKMDSAFERGCRSY